MILLTALFLIIFKASSDGLATKGHKTIAGVIDFIYTSIVTMIVFAWIMGMILFNYGHSFAFIIGGFLLLRFALFDIIFNLFVGENIFFIGSTKLFDKIWQKFFDWTHFPSGYFLGMLKFISLLISVTWLLTK